MSIFPFTRLPYELQLMVLINQPRRLVPSQLTHGRYYVSVTP
jgi:hypothetical protein